MKIEILTPDSILWKGDGSLLQLPGTDGLFEILNNHAPLISILGKGKIKVVANDNTTKYFEISGGVIEVHKNKVIVLAE